MCLTHDSQAKEISCGQWGWTSSTSHPRGGFGGEAALAHLCRSCNIHSIRIDRMLCC